MIVFLALWSAVTAAGALAPIPLGLSAESEPGAVALLWHADAAFAGYWIYASEDRKTFDRVNESPCPRSSFRVERLYRS